MKGKLLFVAGAAVGYVLGARAGRKRYEQIRSAAAKVWDSPGIQKQVHQAQDFAAEKVGDIPGALFDGARKVVTSARKSSAASKQETPDQEVAAKPAASTKSAASAKSTTSAKRTTTTRRATPKKPAAKPAADSATE